MNQVHCLTNSKSIIYLRKRFS